MYLFARPGRTIVFLGALLLVMVLSACSGAPSIPVPALTPAPSPAPPPLPPATTTTAPIVTPTTPPPPPPTTPKPTPKPQTGPMAELRLYMLDFINKDRKQAGLEAVVLGDNAASQKHADDMLMNYYLSHWGTDGLKPYMRYTQEGGFNYESENSAYSGWLNKSDNPDRYAKLDVKEEIRVLQYKMVNEDAESNWGHRDTILNKWHKQVSIGIAFDQRRLALVQQFEGDYIEFTKPPTLAQNILSLSGKISLGTFDTAALYFDHPPQPKTQQDLLQGPRSYGLGGRIAHLVAPPPPGFFYGSQQPGAIQATKWSVDPPPAGSFDIEADISPALINGKGVYTVVVWIKTPSGNKNLTNYSLFVK